MSDEAVAPVDGAEAEAAGPPGATEAEAQPETQPEPEYLEVDDDLSRKHVRITVDGEEVAVPFSELTQGYSRQADYTRKTQDLARQRQEAEEAIQVAQALRANPGLTVQILAQREGMSVEQFLNLPAAQQNAVAQQAVQEDQYAEPLERALAEERQAREALEARIAQREADEELRSVVTGLKTQYQASDEDVRAAINVAMRANLPPQMLPMIHQSLAYQKLQTQQGVRQEATTQQQVDEQARRAAAAAAGQVVGTGTGATGTTAQVASDGRMSLSDAIAAAVDGYPD